MPETSVSAHRVFKTSWFAKAAKKAGIRDAELCKAIAQAMQGQADDLGGGVFKKRLNDNQHRSIILAKAGRWWVYEFVFAKKDKSNISSDELLQFKLLAKSYAALSAKEVQQLMGDHYFLEICHGH
ncbi:MAG: type II toxin-antitoxin system RelE/ParE family toxin [Brachymonas sp.]|nr:type II toxin-antitoxin system RelE/ParE family toxin [Brachymonas sp.]